MPAKAVTVSATFVDTRIIYDFAAAAAAGENPANFNGGDATGQIFYIWENSGKTDSKRNDYKGYAWAEGSVLPEVCHVWRRSDRINGNMTAADADVKGLKCPNDREMVIDGLAAGSKVVIEYVAANEGDAIIWQSSTADEHKTIATIGTGNKAAITGTTTIASGAAINIVSTPGYFGFKVKKNMVITKITISEGTVPTDVVLPSAIAVAEGISNGTVSVSATEAFAGDEITVTATPADGFALEAITVKDADGADVTVTDGKFIMPAKAVTVSATFAEVPMFTITVGTVTNGTVEIASSAAAGEKVYVTLTPAEGYTIDSKPTIKNEAGEDVTDQIEMGDDNGYYIVMPAFNITISLEFSKLYNITLPAETTYGTVTLVNGDGEAIAANKFVAGKEIKIKVTDLAADYKVVAMNGETEITLNPGDGTKFDYYFTMPEGDVTISIVSATGINSIAADKMKDATIFTIGGQRVDKAQKGLYIINGKKVVIK